MPSENIQQYWRVIDANFNRAKEGLRVCEDICRFILNDEVLTQGFKTIRHGLSDVLFDWSPQQCWQARDVSGDVGQQSSALEFRRETLADVGYANVQRAKESIRVLEEFAKLETAERAVEFKNLRYALYNLEKELVKKIPAVSGT